MKTDVKDENNANRIIRQVSKEMGIPFYELFSKSRNHRIVFPRQLAQTILLEKGYSEAKVADLFRQHRTTIYNAVESIEGWKVSDKKKAAEIKRIRDLMFQD